MVQMMVAIEGRTRQQVADWSHVVQRTGEVEIRTDHTDLAHLLGKPHTVAVGSFDIAAAADKHKDYRGLLLTVPSHQPRRPVGEYLLGGQ